MPVKFTTITEQTLVAMEAAVRDECSYEESDFVSLFSQFRMYQENRLKINKDSRESKQASRDALGDGSGGSKGSKSAKMTGCVKLVPVEGQENTFKVEKVSVPAPAPKPKTAEEEDNAPLVPANKIRFTLKKVAEPEINLAENPEALAEHMKSIHEIQSQFMSPEALARMRVIAAEDRAQVEKFKKSEAERKKAEGIAKRKATLAAKKEALANAAKAALVANLKEIESEDSGEETETDVETEDEE